jgi:DNA-binding transcriptional MerR regulator
MFGFGGVERQGRDLGQVIFRLTFHRAGRSIFFTKGGHMLEGTLKISDVAARAGVSAKAIRFYEAEGILPRLARGANGYRLYGPEAVDMLQFLKQAQGLGFTLPEIKEVVTIRRRGEVPCVHVRSLLQAKATELDPKLADLVVLRRRIRRSLAAWGRRPERSAAVCPHIERAPAELGGARVKRTRT